VGEFAEVTRVMAAATTRGSQFGVRHKGRAALLAGELILTVA
jgi:hypothetical protein